jgi:hypothetical protein
MTKPKKPGWRSQIRPIGTAMYAIASAFLTVIAVWQFHASARVLPVLLIFVGLCVMFYFVWYWVFYERPAELEKRLPVSSKELRRRKKEFFENLP